MFVSKYFSVIFLLVILCYSAAQDGTQCETPDQTSGICINIKSCKILLNLLLNQSNNPDVADYLRRSTCGFEGNIPMVCCPRSTTRNNPTNVDEIGNAGMTNGNTNLNGGYNFLRPPRCGFSNTTNPRVVGGIPAKLGEFPWIVALGYRNQNNPNQPKWLCGGTLITDRHILTAGHCVYNRKDLYIARVGELDLYSDNDGANPETIPLIKAKIHEDYSGVTFTNDIAILTLQRPVNNPTVWPICLPVDEPLRSNTFLKYELFVAGWGAIYFNGPSSSILQETTIPVVNNDNCKRAFQNKSVIDDRIICAGYATGGKDSCKGDSGGPLMYGKSKGKENEFYQIGVVSYGFRCAEPGYPGVYTRVTNFIDWIGRNLN